MLEFTPHTKRRKMDKRRAAKIFLARNGICVTCGVQISTSESWFIEHPESLALGGSDEDSELWPAHTRCKAVKDAQDAGKKAQRDRAITSSYKPSSGAPKRFGRPLPGTKDSGLKKLFNGTVVKRS